MNNMNPWIVETLVEYERNRIRRDMKQIRLEEKAMRAGRTEEKTTTARFNRSRLLMLIVPTFVKRMFCVGRQFHRNSSAKASLSVEQAVGKRDHFATDPSINLFGQCGNEIQ